MVTGNTAPSGGGFWAGYATITDCIVSGNTATQMSGGFGIGKSSVLKPGVANLNNSQVINNSAPKAGGFSAAEGGTLTNSVVSNNSGGGIYSGGYSISTDRLTLISSTVSGNNKVGPGGGIYALRGDVVLNSSTIDGNTSIAARRGRIRPRQCHD